MVPVTVDGETVKLAVITYKPDGPGPFPTVIFNHGSTGRGDDAVRGGGRLRRAVADHAVMQCANRIASPGQAKPWEETMHEAGEAA